MAAFLACLLVLTAGVDPQVCAQCWFGSPSAAPHKASDTQNDDTDDEMLATTAPARPGREARRQPQFPKDALSRNVAAIFPPHPRPAQSRPAAPDCEHDFRNGLGAPLLC